MGRLTENTIEQSLIDQLLSHGYTYFNGIDVSPFSESFSSVLLEK